MNNAMSSSVLLVVNGKCTETKETEILQISKLLPTELGGNFSFAVYIFENDLMIHFLTPNQFHMD